MVKFVTVICLKSPKLFDVGGRCTSSTWDFWPCFISNFIHCYLGFGIIMNIGIVFLTEINLLLIFDCWEPTSTNLFNNSKNLHTVYHIPVTPSRLPTMVAAPLLPPWLPPPVVPPDLLSRLTLLFQISQQSCMPNPCPWCPYLTPNFSWLSSFCFPY